MRANDPKGETAAAAAPRTFLHSIRVPYADSDQMGMVYYANYLVYFEMARSAMLREVGTPYGEIEKRGILLPVVEAHCHYLRPARFDDLLEIRTRCSHARGIRLRMDYEVWRAEAGDGSTAGAAGSPGGADPNLLVTGYTEHVCLSPDGKVRRLAPELLRLAWAG